MKCKLNFTLAESILLIGDFRSDTLKYLPLLRHLLRIVNYQLDFFSAFDSNLEY